MNRAHFRLQAVVVVAVIVLVSWPQMRPVRATSIWRTQPASHTREETVEDRRLDYGGDQRARIGYGSLATQPTDETDARRGTGRQPGADIPAASYLPLPAEALALGAKLNGIVGRARTNLNAPIPYARIVLRNMITGQIEARAVADAEGRFTFIDVGASGYIIELIGPDGAVIASSETVAVENGDLKEATIRVAGAESARALYGNQTGPTVTDPMQAAVEAGVTHTTTPEQCVSAGAVC